MLCCANDLSHILVLIKAPNLLLPRPLPLLPQRLKDTEHSPAHAPSQKTCSDWDLRGSVYHSNCKLPSPLRKLKEKYGGEEEEEEVSARHKSKTLKVEPRKLCLRRDIHQKVLSPTNVIWFGIKAWKWWRRPKIGDVKDDCTVLHFSISSFRATKWGWYSDWMSFTVTAVLFPHKGGPSNGLRSVRNRRGGTKQGFLLRVHSHISDGENHYGSRVSFTLVHTLFCHPNSELW